MYYGFPSYVSVAEKRKKAEKLIEKLRKKGETVNPIDAFNGKMAATFWGNATDSSMPPF